MLIYGGDQVELLNSVYHVVWGIPALVLILGVGLWLSIYTGFIQFRWLPKALKQFCGQFAQPQEHGSVSPFRALCTALAATVGTGNLAGVAGAIAIGGPGAIFWMWICGFLGMVIKFAEATLAVHFRQKSPSGEWIGGPMYMIRNGLPRGFAFLATLYSIFGLVAAFGVGNATQVSTMIAGINEMLPVFGLQESQKGNLLMGSILALLVGFLLLGGAKRIGQAAELLVPFAAGLYLLLGGLVLILRADALPEAFLSIFQGAFAPKAVTGGVVGTVVMALRTGISRGVFTNEAGMGTAAMAHAAAEVAHPADQGLMGIVEVFLDTIVICTMTALVILCSGVPIHYGVDAGIELTSSAFASVLGNWVSIVIAVSVCLFALATVLGWGLYGIRCTQYLLGNHAGRIFVYLQIVAILGGAVLKAERIWLAAEILNGLMAIPNLIALLALTPVLQRLLKQKTTGGYYESFHQCQSLLIFSHAYVPPLGRRRQGGRQDHLSSEHRSA